jgi:hypothetical protein
MHIPVFFWACAILAEFVDGTVLLAGFLSFRRISVYRVEKRPAA